MRRGVVFFTLQRIRFRTANEKRDIFGWSQSPSFNNALKQKLVGALGTRMTDRPSEKCLRRRCANYHVTEFRESYWLFDENCPQARKGKWQP